MTAVTSSYIPAVIPADLIRTDTGILWTASNIAATRSDVDDAIAEAIRDLGIDPERIPFLESIPITTARYGGRHPHGPVHRWVSWALPLTAHQRWSYLSHAAGRCLHSADYAIGLREGRWDDDR